MTIISVAAPTRIADLGGWTDTWFARHGVVCHLAIWPGVDVTLRPADGPAGVEVRLHNFDREWHWSPGTPPRACPDPLIGACLDEAEVPDGAWLLEVGSRVPPGASMGTSASLCVALLAALDALRARTGGPAPEADPIAALVARAHRVETVRLEQHSGIQDQWAAAAGGINLIEMTEYPVGRRTALAVSPQTREALQQQLAVVLLERGHESSAVHAQVVEALAQAGPDDPRLDTLRACARDGARALEGGDLGAYGAALTRNTEAQAALQPTLVGPEAQAVIALARSAGALGWKVNGAGGPGGSLTVLAPDIEGRAAFVDRLAHTCPWASVLDVQLAEAGVREAGPAPQA
jgi:D-glycero-alpha-D-manno-heptose-7-phosphate kinase